MTDLTVETPLGKGSFMLARIAMRKKVQYLVWLPVTPEVEANKKYNCIRMEKTRALFGFTAEELGMEE
jgi:hypothetical protein